ncbi:MAG: ferredoxin family protein [Candidatus Atribacteria bacterium]|nr:ferredoxin family protein [Candidatus Atribacteria bacterium]
MRQFYFKNVVTLDLSPEKCTGCGRCLEVCPHDVFFLGSGKAELRERNACMECGACARNCPVEAVTVRAGVGCAYAITMGLLRGKEPSCGE